MKPIKYIGFIGNYLPRRCGIATFTHDLHRAIASERPDLATSVVAMMDSGATYDYPAAVQVQIHDDRMAEYVSAAEFLNDARIDIACLQHEYGIFGGDAGGYIIELLSRLEMPLVTTLHTILATPTPAQRNVMQKIIDASGVLIVMSKKGREFLRSVHDVPASKIELIPHGVPDFPFREPHQAKLKLDFADKTVILTFGLLSPSKGIENVIDAMPDILQVCPNAVYVVLGATHPSIVRQQGEAYRNSLKSRSCELGIEDHVVFYDQFVDQATLLEFISMCDVYVTPYLNEAQMTSGTLAYSFALGKAVVSTPYWHATELLSDGRGVLVPFADAKAIGREISALLTNDVRRQSMRRRAYAEGRSMTWARTAKHYLDVFERARDSKPVFSQPADRVIAVDKGLEIPDIQTGHFLSLCDGVGILQHTVHSVANRSHGYCVDDNARALLLSSTLSKCGEAQLPETVTARFAAFVQHAWNPDTGRFRNFMSYDRRWLDEVGSEDSHGRTLWALAECAAHDGDLSRRAWAGALFKRALPAAEKFTSPRAWAFTLLGLDAYCTLLPSDDLANRARRLLADKLMVRFADAQTESWCWFEDMLGYDNARLPQALIATGLTTGTRPYVETGLKSLRWLMSLQTTPEGYFRPVGTQSFGRVRSPSLPFDQQPIEAAAAISACLTARRAEDLPEWSAAARRAFGWFLGENDLKASLVDPITGSCCDGLHPDRANENNGAESVISYLVGLTEIRCFERDAALIRQKDAFKPPSPPHFARWHCVRSRRRSLSQSQFLNRQALHLRPDPARVVVRPFKPATEPRDLNPTDKTRANHIVDRVLQLDAEVATQQLNDVLENFEGRHRNLLDIFDARAAEMEDALAPHAELNKTQRRLIGAYFLNEYSFEASALFNPSIVRHPDQAGAPAGGVRFILSLRAVGEGHISSLTFRSGTIAADGGVTIEPTARHASVPKVLSRDPVSGGEVVELAFGVEDELSERVIFPITDAQLNGIEDARFVEFGDGANKRFYATYTAYSGRAIRSELLETTDFISFRMTPLGGSAARNKGMALFPRKVNGRYAMISRQDNENLYLIYSDDLFSWDTGGDVILRPEYPWEFVQIGNCGSPIELDEGWLLLTHGVGPVRKYSIGAALLDKNDPAKVLARSREPLLRPEPSERAGYVPNVVYTCGGMRHGDYIILPYAVSDTFSHFATIKIGPLLDALGR